MKKTSKSPLIEVYSIRGEQLLTASDYNFRRRRVEWDEEEDADEAE